MTSIDGNWSVFGINTSLAQIEVSRMGLKNRWLRQLLSAILLFVFGWAASSPLFAQASPPDTPAGRTLKAFLAAFDSEDLAKLQAYVKEYGSPQPADGLQAFSAQTGGFDLLSIRTSTPDSITFMVKGRGDHLTAFGSLRLASTEPPKVKSLAIRAMLPGVTLDPVSITPQMREATIRSISARLAEYYVYPDMAKQMIHAIQEHEKAGNYNSLTDGNDLAEALTKDLLDVSHDKHLFVGYSPFITPDHGENDKPKPPSAAQQAQFRHEMERQNCAFSKAERLPGNIGYLKFDAFNNPDVCGPVVAASMAFLAHTDALIFDLRENHGGNPAMVQLIVSYLFADSTHINDMLNQHDGTTKQYWTLPSVAGPRYLDKPVYVLTSGQTFSGGEEFTYDLQTQKRATIVGETTGGGAHPIDGMPAGDHFMIAVPVGRPINPVTKKDWEGTGVSPDVKTTATDALDTARRLAQKKIADGNDLTGEAKKRP